MEIETRKICMVGDFGVGKTSSVARFVHNEFSDKYQTTIGVKVDTKSVAINERNLKLVIWDIAGRNKFGHVEFTYLRGSSSYLLVVDGTRELTFTTAMELSASIKDRYGDIPFVMLLNKADREEEWELDESHYKELEKLSIPYFITSAKTGDNIEDAFNLLAQKILD